MAVTTMQLFSTPQASIDTINEILGISGRPTATTPAPPVTSDPGSNDIVLPATMTPVTALPTPLVDGTPIVPAGSSSTVTTPATNPGGSDATGDPNVTVDPNNYLATRADSILTSPIFWIVIVLVIGYFLFRK